MSERTAAPESQTTPDAPVVSRSQLSAPDDVLRVEQLGAVRILTLNRPDALNALSSALQHRLVTEFLGAEADPTVSVVLLTGTGRIFSSGADLKEILVEIERGAYRGPAHESGRMVWEVVAQLAKPTIAALNGHAIGGGFELALACDIIVASDTAEVQLPEARRGAGAVFASVVLPRRLPAGVAHQMLFTGDRMDGVTAMHWGLFQSTWPPDQLEDKAIELASRIASNAPLSLRRIKETSTKGASLPIPSAMRLNVGPDPYSSRDWAEGIAAFLEKRAPTWQGK
jgi:enoyl-CoA hydratase